MPLMKFASEKRAKKLRQNHHIAYRAHSLPEGSLTVLTISGVIAVSITLKCVMSNRKRSGGTSNYALDG